MNKMKLAVTVDPSDNSVFRVFEDTRVITIYNVDNFEITESEMVGTMDENVNDIISVVMMMEAECILCGDITEESRSRLDDEGILYYSGFYGNADEAVHDFINGYIVFGPDE